jgi:streptogramin lyase
VLAVLGSTWPSVQQLNHPIGVAVHTQGNLYVNDHRNNRIVKFSSAGKFLAAWVPHGSPAGLFLLPEGIAVDAQSYIYVAANQRLFKLSPAVKVLTIWDKSPYGIGDLAVDSHGKVYTEEDGAPGRLEKLSSTGKVLATWQALCTAG